MPGTASQRGRRTEWCDSAVGARQVAVVHTPHSSSVSYGGQKGNGGESHAFLQALLTNRAKAYFSVDSRKAQMYLRQKDAPSMSPLSDFSEQVLSADATTSDAEKCMGQNIASAQPSGL